ASNGIFKLSALEQPSRKAQALVVTTANDEYWFEYRAQAALGEGGQRLAGPGVIVHVSPSPDVRGPGSSTLRNVLLSNPARHGRPELRPGDRFSDPGAFTLAVVKPARGNARVRFRWTDSVPPRMPQVSTSVVDGTLQVTVESQQDAGSGIGRYTVSLDGRAALQLASDGTDEPVRVGHPLPGTHTINVVAIDRAGNRSAAATRRIRIP